MIHPSYVELMKVVNEGADVGEEPVINSRYSIVCATAKRARQLIDHRKPLIDNTEGKKPLSIAVEELYEGKLKILTDDEAAVEQEKQDEYEEKVKEHKARLREEEKERAEALAREEAEEARLAEEESEDSADLITADDDEEEVVADGNQAEE